MSRTCTRLVKEGKHKLKLKIVGSQENEVDLAIRAEGFFAGSESLEDLDAEIRKEHSKQQHRDQRHTASVSVGEHPGSTGNEDDGLGVGGAVDAAGKPPREAHRACVSFTPSGLDGDSSRFLLSRECGSDGHNADHTENLSTLNISMNMCKQMAMEVRMAAPSRTCEPEQDQVKQQQRTPETNRITEPVDEDPDVLVDFELADSMMMPVSILDLQYEGERLQVSEGPISDSYLYGTLRGHRLKMIKVSHFRMWFDEDEWKREPEVWVHVQHHNLLRLGTPAEGYRQVYDIVALVARFLHLGMKHPSEESIVDRVRAEYHYNTQDIEAEVGRHRAFIARFAQVHVTTNVHESKSICRIISSSSSSMERTLECKRSDVIMAGRRKRIRQLVIPDDPEEPESEADASPNTKAVQGGPCEIVATKSPDTPCIVADHQSLARGGCMSEDREEVDPICCMCDDGGKVTFCDGPCLRSFHATKRRGKNSDCPSLGYSESEMKVLEGKKEKFFCKNCEYGRYQCFCCRELGMWNGQAEGKEQVFRCPEKSCGKFYHLRCLGLADAQCFKACPLHRCDGCKQGGDKLVKCRLCPKAWHHSCIPKEISFEEDELFINPQRGWILGKTVIVYCSTHEYNYELGMPQRQVILLNFPEDSKKNVDNQEERKVVEKQGDRGSVERVSVSGLQAAANKASAGRRGVKSFSSTSKKRPAVLLNQVPYARRTDVVGDKGVRPNEAEDERKTGRDNSLVGHNVLKRKSGTMERNRVDYLKFSPPRRRGIRKGRGV